MAEGETRVDDIANDNEALEAKARQLLGEDVTLDANEVLGTDFEILDRSICAVLVRKNGGAGAIRVTGGTFKNVVTGPTQGTGFVIVTIQAGEDCMLLGTPSVRYFRHCRS
ncbi:MAG: hypothetical protein M1814_005335 [Vezdaea aestivalis]|nr:MAG: hypothetical protein M1814_005335 [Vezdaea aestivalis]